ncbi:hypothetical protein CEXT_507421 [Caerostris extrusa]|uniref:Uncharacterized protein n=1 Tax=Caerostris extrusa TaxID=172846 RepID=A0AAV4W248_CAEEX|nr:hypothetical protein CEXT_507421 [Caerostris extrusa]
MNPQSNVLAMHARTNIEAANMLAKQYEKTSKLMFSADDRSQYKTSKSIIENNKRTTEACNFISDPTLEELDSAIHRLDPNKSPGPDVIFGQMITHFEVENSLLGSTVHDRSHIDYGLGYLRAQFLALPWILNFASQGTSNTANKALGKLSILRKLCETTWGSRPKTVKNAFCSVIRPLLEYATPIWNPSSQFSKMDSVQHRASKIIMGV